MKTTLRHAIIALQMTGLLLLGACGGGSSGLVRSDPAPPPAPPPPPPGGAPAEPCAAPVTGDCVVSPPQSLNWNEYRMTGGRQSDFRLFVDGTNGGLLNLMDGEYRFSGGTQIAGATLVVWDTLVSDVEVLHDFTGMGFAGTSQLWLTGTVRGNVINEELVSLRHKCGTALNACVQDRRSRIEGNYLQGGTGMLEAVLGWDLQVTGTATLDGGLRLIRGTSQSYVLPTAPSSVLVLHAAGGVSGQFANWRGDGLFLEGGLRYTARDVYFDASRISLATAMAAAGATSRATLASAANLDRAFGRADGYALAPRDSLAPAQRRFLDSAASVQHIGDIAQAERTLHSLSGHGHALLADVLHEQTTSVTTQLGNRLAGLRPEAQASSWSEPLAHHGRWTGSNALYGNVAGTDHWLGRRWLLGAAIAGGDASMQFDRMGGQVGGTTRLTGLYVHFRGDRGHATVLAGASRANLHVQRPIDLGDAGEHPAFSQRSIEHAFVHGEVARRMPAGPGWWTPYLAVDYAWLHSAGFTEHGDTGFELVAQPVHGGRLSLAFGGRYAREWDVGSGWLGLTLDARYRRQLASHRDALHAAFLGTPDTDFELEGWAPRSHIGTWGLGLARGLDAGWFWTVDYRQRFGREERGTDWSIAVKRPF